MSRSTSQSSSAAASNTTGLSRSLSLKTNTKPSQKTASIAPADTKLFVSNLRLLDLDLRNDWPGITVQTFSSKNADQKQRIGGVEWALFRLFEIWDPEETGQKLQPFFPPLEPLQSLNLRAALYRCLNELKKNGVLGRESVLRKTMLDECKGDKFYEILALFSTAVLKNDLASRKHAKMALAVSRRLAMATSLPADKQASLLPLAIAHKAALVNVLRRKNEKRIRYTEFDSLLQSKAEEINHRNKQCKATPRSRRPSVPQNEAAAIKKQLRDNWVGNQMWLDTLLHGYDVQLEDAFLNRPFKDVWRMVEKGRELQDVSPEAGLLANLQSRVQEQQDRLKSWRSFHAKLLEEEKVSQPTAASVQVPVKEFRFDEHLKLQLSSTKVANSEPASTKVLRTEYQDILTDMEAELVEATKATLNRPVVTRRGSSFSASPTRRRKSRSDSAPKRPTSSHAEKAKKPAPPLRQQSKEIMPPPPLRREPSATPIDSDATLVGHQPTSRPASSHSPETIRQSRFHHNHQTSESLPAPSSPPRPTPIIQAVEPRSPSPPPSSYFPSEPPILEPPTLSHNDLLAEQILSSVANATPSPVKKQPRLSLLERTRMSMAHTSSFNPISESPTDSDTNPLPTLPQPMAAETMAPLDRRTSLLERTRLSMAAMTQNPRPQPKKDKRKSSRQSLYPVNQFDTPRNRKSIQAIEQAKSGVRTPKEELFSDEVDYDRVFKSRPKIAQSPIFSPSPDDEDIGGDAESGSQDGGDVRRHGRISQLGIDDGYDDYDEGVTGVDLADVDADEDEDCFTQAWANSPSRRGGWGHGKEIIYSAEPKVLRS